MGDEKKTISWRKELRTIIYDSYTPKGKTFNAVLLVIILLSVALVLIESVPSIDKKYHHALHIAEWVITIIFSIEYVARIISVKHPKRYIFSFYGVIDLISTLPLYITLFMAGGSAFLTIRALRLLRIFRIFKINRYIGASRKLKEALKNSRAKILVFLFAIVIICLIAGTVMYLIEGDRNDAFTSIPRSMYWVIVTLTTVGFGDIYPVTSLGQLIASIIMIMGYGIIAVPTGIVTAEFTKVSELERAMEESKHSKRKQGFGRVCPNCDKHIHIHDASYCSHCGHKLNS